MFRGVYLLRNVSFEVVCFCYALRYVHFEVYMFLMLLGMYVVRLMGRSPQICTVTNFSEDFLIFPLCCLSICF